MTTAGRLPRKVLHVMNAAGGGAALSTLALIRELEKAGVRACVVCHDAGTAEEKEAVRDAVRGEVEFTHLFWWNRKIRADLWKRPALEVLQWLRTRGRLGSVGSVALAARRWGAELVHTNTILTPEGGNAARLLGLPHVWHVRELTGPDDPFQLPLHGAALAKYLCEHASTVVANSAASAAPLRAWLPAGRLVVIPNGIDLFAFERIAPRSVGTPVVAMLGNLTSRTKKHGLFVEAAKRTTGAEFRLYGHAPAPGSDAYADAVRAQCADAGVRVMGFTAAEAALREVDIVVHPADNESFGRTVVEAMAAGLPVVGARGGGVAETVADQETGLLFAPDSAEHLAQHLAALIRDPALRRRLGQAGRARARASYSLDSHAKRVGAVYQEALAAPLESGWTTLTLLGGLA